MQIKVSYRGAVSSLLATAFLFTSCQKSDLVNSDDAASGNTIAVAATQSAPASSGAIDSVYLVQPCGRNGRRDSVAQSALPASIGSYLTATYTGYTFHKAFAVKTASTLTGYVVVIYYNNKPVGLQFDTNGNLVKVLEQREKGDLTGPGHHRGGRFEHRDGQQRDSVALAALPASVTAYFAANYAGDTLVKAFRGKDSTLVVLSKNNGAFATIFSASGTFVNRVQLNNRQGACQPIDLSGVPAVAANYLFTTFPNYVFEKAFVLSAGGAVKGYVVVIDANNTKYAVEFDATGSFVRLKILH